MHLIVVITEEAEPACSKILLLNADTVQEEYNLCHVRSHGLDPIKEFLLVL